jgi:DNA-binding GntR family transcriptional regulator
MPAAQNSLLHPRLETVLSGEIGDGLLKIGDRRPTEDALLARGKVRRSNVRRAIHNLVNRELVATMTAGENFRHSFYRPPAPARGSWNTAW